MEPGDPDEPPVLQYAEVVRGSAGWLARQPLALIVILAFLLPGVVSFLLREQRRWRCLLLLLVIPAAFLFFGPFWGEVLFRGSGHAMTEAGLWPFLLMCVATPAWSVLTALRDHDRAGVR